MRRKEIIIAYSRYWFSLMMLHGGAFLHADLKKPSIAGGRIDMENDSAVFMDDAADERITVGGDIRHRRQMFHRVWGKIPRA